MTTSEKFVGLVDAVSRKCFGGRIPEDRVFFIGAILYTFFPDDPPAEFRGQFTPAEWEEVQKNFAFELASATDALHRSRTDAWKN